MRTLKLIAVLAAGMIATAGCTDSAIVSAQGAFWLAALPTILSAATALAGLVSSIPGV